MADRRPYYHKVKKKIASMHIYMPMNSCMYVSGFVRDEEPMLSKHDTEQKLEHDVANARTLMPSPCSMSIHRKSSRYDKEETLQCRYIAKVRCPIHRKGSMAHRGQMPEVLYVTIVQCPYIGTRRAKSTIPHREPRYLLRSSFELQTNAETLIECEPMITTMSS